jgi:hypothetical protein
VAGVPLTRAELLERVSPEFRHYYAETFPAAEPIAFVPTTDWHAELGLPPARPAPWEANSPSDDLVGQVERLIARAERHPALTDRDRRALAALVEGIEGVLEAHDQMRERDLQEELAFAVDYAALGGGHGRGWSRLLPDASVPADMRSAAETLRDRVAADLRIKPPRLRWYARTFSEPSSLGFRMEHGTLGFVVAGFRSAVFVRRDASFEQVVEAVAHELYHVAYPGVNEERAKAYGERWLSDVLRDLAAWQDAA